MVSNTAHLVTTGFCDVKYATTTALNAVQTETEVNTIAITSLQSQ